MGQFSYNMVDSFSVKRHKNYVGIVFAFIFNPFTVGVCAEENVCLCARMFLNDDGPRVTCLFSILKLNDHTHDTALYKCTVVLLLLA